VLTVLLLVVSVTCVAALPHHLVRFASLRDFKVNPYVKPGPGDERSPCPFINTLANHGYLHHDGKGIAKQELADSFKNVLGCSSFFANSFAGLAFNKFVEPGQSTIHLSLLIKRMTDGGIEHDASLSRKDPQPDPKKPQVDQTIPDVARVEAGLTVMGKTKDDDIISPTDMAKYRKSVETPTTDTKTKLVAAAEACLLLGVGAGDKGLTVKVLRSFVEEEKFPEPWVQSRHWFGSGFGLTNLIPCMTSLGIHKSFSTKDIPYFEQVSDSVSSGSDDSVSAKLSSDRASGSGAKKHKRRH